MVIKFRYVGNEGEFHEGIPARHLQEEEYDELTKEQKELVNSSALYKVVSKNHPGEVAEEAK